MVEREKYRIRTPLVPVRLLPTTRTTPLTKAYAPFALGLVPMTSCLVGLVLTTLLRAALPKESKLTPSILVGRSIDRMGPWIMNGLLAPPLVGAGAFDLLVRPRLGALFLNSPVVVLVLLLLVVCPPCVVLLNLKTVGRVSPPLLHTVNLERLKLGW